MQEASTADSSAASMHSRAAPAATSAHAAADWQQFKQLIISPQLQTGIDAFAESVQSRSKDLSALGLDASLVRKAAATAILEVSQLPLISQSHASKER